MPFFPGVVLGQSVGGGPWLLIDGATGMVGNTIPVYRHAHRQIQGRTVHYHRTTGD